MVCDAVKSKVVTMDVAARVLELDSMFLEQDQSSGPIGALYMKEMEE